MKRVIALVLCIGALPFVFNASAYAGEKAKSEGLETKGETKQSTAEWLWEDYKKPVGLTYNAQAKIQAAYLWRGQYSGAFNLQASANVGYGGLYFDMWWNLGTYDWSFNSFQPEVDFSLGFSRWGLNIYMLYVHNFDCGFFDFSNKFGGGNRLELDVLYTLSNKVPLTIRWATRVAASDGYFPDSISPLQRAYSSYLELSYTHKFKYDISLYGAVGISPWKSTYTWYVRDFGVVNIDVRLRKDWSLSERCGLMLQGQVMLNPSMLAYDPKSYEWHPNAPAAQTVNANIAVGVYLK